MARLEFDERTIQKLFGHEAAEDEDPLRLREYYFKSSTYDQVVTDLPVRVLVGHKGIGKSALFQNAILEQRDSNNLVIVLKPDDVLDIEKDDADFLRAIRYWKRGLLQILANRAAKALGLNARAVASAIEEGQSILPALASRIASEGVDNATSAQFLKDRHLTTYIDDLDRGWEGRPRDVKRISALLNAVRDLANEESGLRFRISLRSDVYFLVRTSDESTDKIEGSVIWHSWTNHEIFALLVKRIETFFGRNLDYEWLRTRSPNELASYLAPVFDDRFRGQGHWRNAPTHRVLMSLIRKRPRDLVKLCSLSARNARIAKHAKIYTEDLENSFEEYSQGRVQDTINEYRSELPDVERLILNMRPTKKEKTAKAGYVYETADLLKKIQDITEQGQFRFKLGRVASKKDLAAFMYKINFLTARKERSNLIIRKYFEEQRYLQSELVDFGFNWEIHPAYRWALQPDDPNSIYYSLILSSDDG
ncbi:P-loop ATPase, Sll1717 family [Actinophytocola algeriensis]|uniref:ATP-binding protein n=1 Tax=Actinophytocola algeriensis TaxID=1768010 RepID=A0A7W7VEH7_9PSEU|nr:ATP-binding protein [Actinophytocola algeriensis]MBB4907273.1 hypothetical protein [Actinophytocola algeriensis]MBE1478756.1 hypothetical protein [Actinophytocola algeriensis]